MRTPRVWSWIVVDASARDSKDERFIPKVQVYVEWSRAVPLHVFFLMGDTEVDEQWEVEAECILQLIGQGGENMKRWASLPDNR